MKSVHLYTNVRTYSLLFVAASFLLLAFNNCAQNGSIAVRSTASTSASAPAASVVAPPPVPVYIDKVKDITVNDNSQKKVDILIVIDNSGSMQPEQANMASRFASFIDELQGLDWQVGIVTTDVDNDAYLKDGRLIHYPSDENQFILTSAMDITTVKDNFAGMVQRPETGSSDEQGIKATYRTLERALDNSNLSVNAPNRQLIRPDAALSVIVVTNSDETFPSNTKDTIRNNPNNLFNLVVNNWSNKKFSYHSIIVRSGDKTCLNDSNFSNEGYGKTYETMSGLTGGLLGTVCAADYSSQLSSIGQSVFLLVKNLQLDCPPVDSDKDGKLDIMVQYSYVDTQNKSQTQLFTDYVVNKSQLIGNNPFSPGQYHVQYRCQQ